MTNNFQPTTSGHAYDSAMPTTTVTTVTPNHFTTKRTSSSTSSGTSGGTGARAVFSRDKCDRNVTSRERMQSEYVTACRYLASSLRRDVAPVQQRIIAEYVGQGMEADVICAAVDETMGAPRPSWAYCASILRRCEAEGIRTLEQWISAKAARAAAAERNRAHSYNPALNYEQRSYSDADFPDIFEILGKKEGV